MTAGAATPPLDGEAEYQDGQQARPLWLRARLVSSSLELRRADGTAVAAWPVAALRVVDRAGGVLRLAPDGSDARLLLSDARLVSALEQAQRPLRRAAWGRRLRAAALAAVAVPAAALGLWRGWPPAADAIARAVPAAWERSIGAATAAAVIGRKRVCDAPEGQAALDALLARLVAASGGHRATAPEAVAASVRARVVDEPVVNALAAPGGEILVYRGLLDRARSADELAGVLAHELGHVEHRHGLRGVTRAAGLFVLSGALSGGSDAVGLAAALAVLSNSRAFEREADTTGARTLAAAGIGTQGLEAFFGRLEQERSKNAVQLSEYLRTHPTDGDRVAALRAAERPATPAPALSPAQWAALKSICGPASAGRSGRTGAAAARPERQAAGSPPRRRLGVFGGWEAWAGEENGEPLCYVLGFALPAQGEAGGRKARLWVTHRPWREMDDIAFAPDRPPPPDGAGMRLEFGGRRVPMRMRGSFAAPRDSAALSAALRAAAAEGVAEAVIGWSDGTEGSARSWRFALAGLAQAHAAIGEACDAGL